MSEWRQAGALEVLTHEVEERWPATTVWTIGDTDHRRRASDHNPNAEGVVCAVDIVGQAQAGALWQHILDVRDERVKYAIHYGRIVNSSVSPWQVRTYQGTNPHSHHIHVSVGRGPSGSSIRSDLYDDTSPWGLIQPKPVPVIEPQQEEDPLAEYAAELAAIAMNTKRAAEQVERSAHLSHALVAAEVARVRERAGLPIEAASDREWADRIARGAATLDDAVDALIKRAG